MKTFINFLRECYFILEARGGNPKYSDEHANINFYNHLISFPEVRELIKNRDYDAINEIITQELEKARTDESHPLHFNNASDEGFSGKTKTANHLDAYYSEIDRAVPGFMSLIQSNKGRNIASKGWVGRVSGGEHEASKPSWTGNVKGQGRFDYVFSDPEDPRKHHRVSGKDYRGSQAGSAQSDQAAATLERGIEIVAQQKIKDLLANRPRRKSGETDAEYKKRINDAKAKAREEKEQILSTAKAEVDAIRDLMASTKGMSPEEQKDVYSQVQLKMDELETVLPGVKRAAGQEMVTGTGQFSRGKTAQSLWTTGGEGSSFRDPRQQSVGLRARAGKGGGREMAVAGDISAAQKEKAAQKERQTTFAQFSRIAAQSQKALSKADRELEDANDEMQDASVPIDPDTKKPVLRQFRKNIEGHIAADPMSRTSRVNLQRRTRAELRLSNAQTNRDNAAVAHDTNVQQVQAIQAQQPAPEQPQQQQPAPEQPQQQQPAPEQPQQQQPAPEQPQQAPQQPQQQQPAPEQPQQEPEGKKPRKGLNGLLKRMDAAATRNNIEQ
jgi:hypothetical protein